MDKIVKISKNERKSLFIDVADKVGIADYMVEKDFWVSWVLDKIFSDEELGKILCFKGGTSLSKVFGLIDRFSEDIDLILSQKTILKENETLEQVSKKKQSEFNIEINSRAASFIANTLKNKIDKVLSNVCEVLSDENDGNILFVKFPNVFDYGYIQPDIKLEIGPLALWNPNEKYPLSSFVATELPELNLTTPIIPTIKPERTFWEKITILHHEHYRPESSASLPRYSRHYYDVFKIGHSKYKNDALTNLNLLSEVVEFKKRFYPRGWARYGEATAGTIRLYPAEHNLQILADDYQKMQNMIFGKAPKWEDILSYLKTLESEINYNA